MADVRYKTNEDSGSPNMISTNAVTSFSLLDCSNPLAEKGVITKQPKVTQPQQKETKFSVGFFPVLELPSLDNDNAKGMSFGGDNKFFAHLVKSSVEYDSTFQVGSSSAEGSTTVKIEEEKTNWQQGLFECWKTEPKVLATTAVCPELTQYNISMQVSSTREGNEDTKLCGYIFVKVLLIGAWTMIGCLFREMPVLWIGLFDYLSKTSYLWYIMWSARKIRKKISERFNLKDFNNLCLLCLCNWFKAVFCERCLLCQLHSELKYQKQQGGPHSVIFY